MLCFIGSEFEHKPDYQKLKNIFLDFFRGEVVTQVNLMGLKHVICVVSHPGGVRLSVSKVSLKASGTKIPKVELTDCGPIIEFVMRRTRFASDDLMKLAMEQPGSGKKKQSKNIKKNVFGESIGTLHREKQNLNEITHNLKKTKALRPRKSEKQAKKQESQ